MISKGKQDATLAAPGVKLPVNVKMSASMVARLFNLDRDMRTRVLTNPSKELDSVFNQEVPGSQTLFVITGKLCAR